MMLVLSIFPGGGLLDVAFESEGFCVVKGPDPLWGGDIRRFHPPSGVFAGVIGGDPCQSHSALANLVRAKGLEPSFQDLSSEYERVVEEAKPRWFLRENVRRAPAIEPAGYDVRTFLLDNHASLGEEQMRTRRFWFGTRGFPAPELRKHIEFARTIPQGSVAARRAVHGGHDETPWHRDGDSGWKQAVTADPRRVPVKLGGSGKPKASVTGRHEGAIGVTGGHAGNPPRYTLEEMLDLQGLPADHFKHSPFTMQGKRKIVGNGVPQAMGRALARAIRLALAELAA